MKSIRHWRRIVGIDRVAGRRCSAASAVTRVALLTVKGSPKGIIASACWAAAEAKAMSSSSAVVASTIGRATPSFRAVWGNSSATVNL